MAIDISQVCEKTKNLVNDTQKMIFGDRDVQSRHKFHSSYFIEYIFLTKSDPLENFSQFTGIRPTCTIAEKSYLD